MMTLETKVESSKPQIGLAGLVKSEESTDDKFSQMLKELGFGTDNKESSDEKKLSNVSNTKTEKIKEIKNEKADLRELLSSLSDEEKSDLSFFNPQIIKSLSITEVKELIHEAKNYLKSKLQTFIDEKEMPRTLKSLVDSAKKFGIELEKITLQEMSAQEGKKSSDQIKKLPLFKDETKVAIPNDLSAKGINPLKLQDEKIEKSEQKESLQTILNSKKSSKEEPQSVKVVSENATQKITVTKSVDSKQQLQSTTTEVEKIADMKNINDLQTPHEPIKEPINKNKDDIVKNLESLLGLSKKELKEKESDKKQENGNNKDSSLISNNISKELNIKSNEAKQMLGNLSTSLKEAADNYRPPFTKLTMALNPEKLGSVEVTIVQRGNNLHINLGSNTSALNILSQNIADLKTQLSNSGLSNATVNLTTQVVETTSNSANNNNQNSGSLNQNSFNEQQQNSQGQQQQHQNHRQRVIKDIYESLNLSENETVTQVEIILPKYV